MQSFKQKNMETYEEHTEIINGKYYLVVNGDFFRISKKECEIRKREEYLRRNLFKI